MVEWGPLYLTIGSGCCIIELGPISLIGWVGVSVLDSGRGKMMRILSKTPNLENIREVIVVDTNVWIS